MFLYLVEWYFGIMRSLGIVSILVCVFFANCWFFDNKPVQQTITSKQSIDSFLSSSPYTVIITYSEDCPFCIRYTETIRELNRKLPQNFKLYLLKVLEDENWDFQDEYLPSSELLNRNKKYLISSYDLMVYPEAIVLDSAGNMLYKGKIDDRAHETGVVKTVVTHEYLKNAIDEISIGSVKYQTETKALGCFIESGN